MQTRCKYITQDARQSIAECWENGARVLDIAQIVGVHPSTIYEELKRGETGNLDKNQRMEYDPELAERRFQENLRRRGNRRSAKQGA